MSNKNNDRKEIVKEMFYLTFVGINVIQKRNEEFFSNMFQDHRWFALILLICIRKDFIEMIFHQDREILSSCTHESLMNIEIVAIIDDEY